jgi:hypothetical protein
MRIYIYLAVFFLSAIRALAQSSPEKKYYDWAKPETIERVKVNDTTDRPADVLMDERAIEYKYGAQELEYYSFRHMVVQINTDRGLERFNKLYIGVDDVIDIILIKARSISPKGVVKEINEGQMKDQTDEEDGRKSKIFAFEGLEVGSIIEYIVYTKNYYEVFGRMIFQNDLPVHKARFELYSPDNLQFKLKGYNNFPVIKDTTIGDKNHYTTDYFTVDPLFEEKYSNFRANVCRVEYKLAYNTSNKGKVPIYTYAEVAKNVYNRIYSPSERPAKSLEKIISNLKLKEASPEKRARLVENYFKSTISVKTNQRLSEEVEDILKNKLASESGITKVMAQALELAGVKTELVITTNRYQVRFDSDFETYNFLGDYLIYLPVLNKFIAPSKFSYRLDITPYDYIGNNGLFVKAVEAGGVKMGLGSIKKIGIPTVDDTKETIKVEVLLNLNDDKMSVSYHKEMGGYLSTFYKPAYFILDKENRDKIIDELLKGVSKDAKISEVAVTHTDMNNVDDKEPFTIDAKMEISELLERAGTRYLFKLGEIIGQQSEMYQNKKRQTDIEVEYPHQYLRIIRFKIPDGYDVQGLEKIKMNFVLTEDGAQTAGFISDYTLDADGWTTVTVKEFYGKIIYHVSKYEEYRKVINAAADFNKVVIVFVKK